MPGGKEFNVDLDVRGKITLKDIPNNTPTGFLVWNSDIKDIAQRTPAQIISDLGLITAVNIAAAYYTKTQLQTSGQSSVHWNNISNKPSTFPATAHTHSFAELTGKPDSLVGYGILDAYTKVQTDAFLLGKINLNDTIQNTNSHGGRKLYINTLDNVFAAADKKYFTKMTLHKKEVGGVTYPNPINQGNISLPQWEDSPVYQTFGAGNLFDNSYETTHSIPTDSYAVISIDFTEDGTGYFPGYPYGTYYLSFYSTNFAESAFVRFYNGYAPHGIGYKTTPFTSFIGSSVLQCEDYGNYQRRELQFVVIGSSTRATGISQLEMKSSRPNFSGQSPLVTNYGPNKLNQLLKFGQQTTDNIILNPTGDITAKRYIIPGGTASQFLKANGTIDSNVYLTGATVPAQTWASITGKPSTFPPSAHTHTIGEVTGLQGALDAKQPVGSYMLTSHAANAITTANINSWNTAVGWGNHAGIYEPKFTKNTAFNKNFGTDAGTVAEGNHTHTFASLTTKPTTLGGYGITDAYTKVQTDTNITTAVDAIQIGGRNLVLNTRDLTTGDVNAVDGSRKEYSWVDIGTSLNTLPNNTQITISFDVDAKNIIPSFLIYNGNRKGRKTFSTAPLTLPQGISRQRVTVNLIDRADFTQESNSLEFFSTYGTNNFYTISRIKIELGNKNTDWTPAPEDQVSDWNTTDVNDFSFIKNKPTKLSQFTNDSNFLIQETDPTVPAHVKSISTGNITNWNTAYTNNHTHDNKAFLDTINQNLGTTNTPTFNSITATSIIKSGGTVNQILMANGTTIEKSSIVNDIEIGGTNIALDSESVIIPSYGGSTMVHTTNYSVSEWGTTKAVRHQLSGGSNSIRATRSFGAVPLNERRSISFYVKNLGTKAIYFSSNEGGKTYTLAVGELKLVKWENILGYGTGDIQIQVVSSVFTDSFDFAIWRVKVERGSKCTDWSPAPEDQVSDWNTTDVNDFSFIKNKPTTFPATAHSHQIVDITGLQNVLNGKEPTFTKNTAFNKDFGTGTNTVVQGNDSRVNNGQTAFGWGNHANLYPSRATVGGSANSVLASDTRSVNPLPTTDLNSGVWFDFKGTAALGIPSGAAFAGVMTLVPYSDDSGNGNAAFRLAQSDNKLFFQNYNTGEWGTWNEIWSTNNFTQTTVNSWNTAVTNSHTHSNKTQLDTINQSLGINYSPTFENLHLTGNLNSGGLTIGDTAGRLRFNRQATNEIGILGENNGWADMRGNNFITTTYGDASQWKQAFSWGDHATQGYIKTFTDTTYTGSTSIILSGTSFQRAGFSGDVTAAQNVNTLTIANAAVTFAKFQNVNTQRLLGRGTVGVGSIQEITLGANLSLNTSGVLSATDTIYTSGTNIIVSGTTISTIASPSFSGSITASSFFESSLRKFKTNIKPLEKSGLELVNELEIVTFDRIDSEIKDKIGIIADDSPKEFLSEEKDSVDLYKTVFIQAKAIQELTKKLEYMEKLIKNMTDGR